MNAVVKTNSAAMVLRPQTFEQLLQFAQMAAKSTMVPPQYKGKPEDIMLAVQLGSELGLAPMQSLQNVATINGRPSVYGDALIGLCRQSALCKDVEEKVEGAGDQLTATCKATRVGAAPVIHTFSVADAKKAGLWGKTGPWTQYPNRMLQMRARSFALRDAFPDILRGLITAEEAADIPRDTFVGTTIEASSPFPTAVDIPPETIKPLTADEKIQRWLTKLALELSAATTSEEIDGILARDDVQRAQDKLRGDHKDRLQDLLDEAVRRAQSLETSAPNGDEPPAGLFGDLSVAADAP